jgi:transmembrane sensor
MLSSGEKQTDLNEIDLEALRWLALIERGPLPPQEQRRFAAWVASDIKHRGAMIRARAASLRLDRLAAFAGGRSVLENVPRQRPVLQKYTTRRGMIAATVAAAGLMGTGAWLERGRMDEIWGGTRYTTEVGELKKLVLEDGSVITMNTQTEVRVKYTRDRRDIRLVRGEAMFTVAHDATRPFAVRVREWTAVAVGTAFAIRRLDETTTDVTVTEGVVQLLPLDEAASAAQPRLTANQKALLGADGKVQRYSVSDTEIGLLLAWRTRLVVFTGEPLRQALTEMNRYSRRPIVVDDPELAERRIVGVFSTSDTQTFVSAMTATLGVETVGTDNVVLLRRVN